MTNEFYGAKIYLKSGQMLDIRCEFDGGYPLYYFGADDGRCFYFPVDSISYIEFSAERSAIMESRRLQEEKEIMKKESEIC